MHLRALYVFIICITIASSEWFYEVSAVELNEKHEWWVGSLTGYEVKIKTGDEYAISGTKSKVSLQLVGRQRESEWFVLRDEFTPGKISKFTLRTTSVGVLLMVRIEMTHAPQTIDEWFIEYIKVKYNDRENTFPLYEFITDHTEVITDKTKLPQRLNSAILLGQRKREIESKKGKWIWKNDQEDGLPRILEPGLYTELPPDVKMTDARMRDFIMNEYHNLENSQHKVKQYKQTPWNSLEVYKNIFTHPEIDVLPDFINEWDTDQEFGRQILNGINPTAVEIIMGAIDGSNITYDHLDGLIEEHTMEDAIEKGKLFMVNHFESMKDVPRNIDIFGKQLYAPDPLCMLYEHSNGTFVPVAIQLKANDSSTIFTPKDNEYDWLLAKMHFRCTDGNHQEWISHYLSTHAAIEPIAISLLRLLPRSHPIHKLLRPHLQSVIAINQMAREGILRPTHVVQLTISISGLESVKKGYKTFSFNDLDIPKFIEKRGTQQLKNYFYCDDVIEMWKIIEKYVSRVITKYYSSNQDVKYDYELQNWISETATEGFGWKDGNTRDVPTKFDTIEELSSFCAVVIATSSIQHSAVSFGQFYVYQYVPNAPLVLRQPIHKHGEGSLEKVLDTLPSVLGSTVQAGTSYVLSQHSQGEVYLGEFPMDLFQEKKITKIRNMFREELERYQKIIINRNSNVKYPYEYLRRDRVPVGTSL